MDLSFSSNACVCFTAAPVAHIIRVDVFYVIFYLFIHVCVHLFVYLSFCWFIYLLSWTSAATPLSVSQLLLLHTLYGCCSVLQCLTNSMHESSLVFCAARILSCILRCSALQCVRFAAAPVAHILWR